MTLVVCRQEGDDVFIHSDSKITQEFGTSAERDLRHNRPLAGLLKTVFLHPHICLSFAGQTHHVSEFLKAFLTTSLSDWNTNKLIGALLELHARSQGECEFILCEAVKRVPHIIAVKDGTVHADLSSAWIGSHDAFEAYQAAFHGTKSQAVNERMRSAFRAVIDNPAIPEVGHFHIEAYLDHHIRDAKGDSVFLYEWKQETDSGSEVQRIEANTPTAVTFGKAEFGAFGTSYFRSVSTMRHAVAIHFPHARFGVLLCPQVDCEQPVLFQHCSPTEFLQAIWEIHEIALEGMAVISDTEFRFLRNYS